ncbi:hypothetical protein H4582DRAFT_2097746 [Lactarius indigo]|nr:hypothetical protein H4582DRAFT_2097746 [Lactarius indigo]
MISSVINLAIKFPAYGHALWDPDPGNLYPAVEVGDVGYIHEGKFHRLFNALLPAEDESHEDYGVPEGHEQLTLNLKKHINIGRLGPNNFCSAKVISMPESRHLSQGPDEIRKVTFSCPMKEGAVLCLPIEATGENTVASADFGRWIIKPIDRWFVWARQLGLRIDRMEDIILVTGIHRTRSWTNVAFPGGQDAQASFGAKADHRGGIVNWKFSHASSRGVVLNYGPDGENLPEDQCIFIRGYRVTRKLRILPPKLKGAAGPNPDPDGYDEPDVELVQIPPVPEYRVPLHILLEYIADEAPPDCMLLVHDDDLARLDEVYDNIPLDVVLSHIRSLKPTVHNTRIDLFSVHNRTSADAESAWVATLSNIFEKQSLSSTSSALPGPHVRTTQIFPPGEHSGGYTQQLGSAQHNEPGHPRPTRHIYAPPAYDGYVSTIPRARDPIAPQPGARYINHSILPPALPRACALESAWPPYQFDGFTAQSHPISPELLYQPVPSSYQFVSSRAPEWPHSQVSSGNDYPERSSTASPISPSSRTDSKAYPSHNRDPQTRQGYLKEAHIPYQTPAPGNSAFPEPTPVPTSGSVQRSHPGQSSIHYASASDSIQRSPSGQSTARYPPASSSAQHNYTGRPAALSAACYLPIQPVDSTNTSYPVPQQTSDHVVPHGYRYAPAVLFSNRGLSATHYPPTSSPVQHSFTEQSTTSSPPTPTSTFDSTDTSHSGPQPASHRYGTNASDDPRPSSRSYQTTAPVTPDPLYRGTQPQERGVASSQLDHQDVYEYDNMDEDRPKSPRGGPGVVQGRQYNCRLPGCNRPMFFDRHFNEFWEWCSPQHIQAGLGQRIEKVCRHCGVWPRKYGHKFCGGPSCNKNGVPIPNQ